MTHPGRIIGLGVLIATLTTAAAPRLLSQSRAPSEEYRLKAAFVYRFPQFVDWPSPALSGRNSLHICVSRPNPFGGLLDELIADETLDGRRLIVQTIADRNDVENCHVLFINATAASAKSLLDEAAHRPVLTVGESPTFLDNGGVINLRVIDRRVRFEVNAVAAERAGLKLSSQLLRLAMTVRGAS